MEFTYEVVSLWRHPADELLTADLGVVPLAMLGRLPEGLSLEDGLFALAQLTQQHHALLDRPQHLFIEAASLLLAVARDEGNGVALVEQAHHALDLHAADLQVLRDAREVHVAGWWVAAFLAGGC